jgi:hypothetical protein
MMMMMMLMLLLLMPHLLLRVCAFLSIRCLEYRDRSRQSAHLLVAAPST